MPRLKDKYQQDVVPALMQEFGYDNVMQVPKVTKIVVNTSLKDGIRDIKVLETAASEIAQVTGQKAIIRRARRSIANFKLREGMPIGTMVTLRRQRMYEFLDRLITIAIPRVRDFRGRMASRSTAAGTTPWGSKSKSSSRRSTTTRSLVSPG